VDLIFKLKFGIKIMEGLACITGLLCWAKLYPRFWKAFPIYLFIITCCEFAGWYMNTHGIKGSKIMYSYFVVPLEFLFMYFLYYKNLPKQFLKTVFAFSLIYLLSWGGELIFVQHTKWIWLSMSYTVGNIIMLILGIIYFLQLLKSEKLLSYKKQIFYWVNLGLMLFYVGTFPFYATLGILYKEAPKLYEILYWMSVTLNYFLYSFFIIGFLCSNTNQK
jgi:hypothetical protein